MPWYTKGGGGVLSGGTAQKGVSFVGTTKKGGGVLGSATARKKGNLEGGS